jgi:cell division protein FtsW
MGLRGFFQPLPRGNVHGLRLVGYTVALVAYGTFMVASASEGQAALNGSAFSIMSADVLWLVIGFVAMLVMMSVRLSNVVRLANYILIASLGLLVFVMLKGTTVSGGQRWISFGGLSLQPSEIFKLAAILYVASTVERLHGRLGDGQHLVLWMSPILVGLGFILLEHDLGTASIIGAVGFIMLIQAGMSWFQVAVGVGTAISGVMVYTSHSAYAWARVAAVLHQGSYHASWGYQLLQSKIGLGAGGLFGLGYGHSREKWGLLPNPHTDFIFSIIGEELGFVGAMVVLALFVGFIIEATAIARACTNEVYRLLAVGITAWIALEALINVASVVGLWAVTGVPLPFLSYGGSALTMELAAVGLLYSIAHDTSRSARLELRREQPPLITIGARRAPMMTHRPHASQHRAPQRRP